MVHITVWTLVHNFNHGIPKKRRDTLPWKNAINLVLAVLTFACIFAIGAALAEQSVLGVILAIIGVIVFMTVGFTLKRKFTESK